MARGLSQLRALTKVEPIARNDQDRVVAENGRMTANEGRQGCADPRPPAPGPSEPGKLRTPEPLRYLAQLRAEHECGCASRPANQRVGEE